MAEFDCIIYKVVYNLLYFTFVSFDIKCCARECQAELNAFLFTRTLKSFYCMLYYLVNIKCCNLKADSLRVKFIKRKYIACKLGKSFGFK